ncbi:putative effector protein [Ceratobasidium theobromae]|uniref:Putative effector protein n=1 Tax=Ceratobasidium theobromae TaxID=1582974 RepID=A0A5N5QFA3_9AGAM|nr:putative effector protein [Ceratobasidium theobromae]
MQLTTLVIFIGISFYGVGGAYADGNFGASCKWMKLEGTKLTADCESMTEDGSPIRTTSLELNNCVANINGKLQCKSK